MFKQPHEEPFFSACLLLGFVLACSVLLAFIGWVLS